jgi:uncharacterized protein YrzB (UPF0473 family)
VYFATENDNVFVVTDANGNKFECEVLDTLQRGQKEYVVLLPVGQEEEEETEVIILQVAKTLDGQEELLPVDEGEELDAVFEEFLSRNECNCNGECEE